MMKTWTLRDAAYEAFNRWPLLVVLCLVGAAVGWGIGRLLPPDYRAIAHVYIGFNAYKAYEDSRFLARSNPRYSDIDDYKNWQMSQLDEMMNQDDLLEATLTQLRRQDDRWESVDIDRLRSMLSTEWRSAGQWGLVAINRDADLASQAAQAWSEVAIDTTLKATGLAEQAILLDEELGPLHKQKVSMETRLAELDLIENSFLEQKPVVQQLPGDQPLGVAARWKILGLAARLAAYTPTWMDVLEAQPGEQAVAGEYLTWLDQLLAYIENERQVLTPSLAGVKDRLEKMQAEYDALYAASLGISPNIIVKNTDFVEPYLIRQDSLIMLLGGLVGVCAWLFLQLAFIARRMRTDGEA